MKNIGISSYRSRGGNAVIFFLLLIAGLFMAIPMIFVISNAFKPVNELFIFPPKLLPMRYTFDNFRDLGSLLGDSWLPFSHYVFNSVFITVAGTVGNIIICSMAAYMMSKHRFPGHAILFRIVVISLLFSGSVTAMPSYIISTRIGLVNNYWALFVPALASPMGLFLMKQFMDQMVPDTLIEAVRLDGGGEGTIFLRVVMPIVKPAWLTLCIFAFQTMWGATGGALIFDENLKTLPTALANIMSGGIARTGVASTVSLLLILPPVTVFLLTQSNVMQTMSTSGIK